MPLYSKKVTFELEQSKEIYQKYFTFEKQKALNKYPIPLILLLFGMMSTLGVIIHSDLLSLIGLIALCLIVFYYLYYLVSYQNRIRQFYDELGKKVPEPFTFWFDEKHIGYDASDAKSQINWSKIKQYDLNDGDLYIYLDDSELFDIISIQILEKELFDKFHHILLKKKIAIR